MGTVKCRSSIVVLGVHSTCDPMLMLCGGSCNVQSCVLPCPAGPAGMEKKRYLQCICYDSWLQRARIMIEALLPASQPSFSKCQSVKYCSSTNIVLL